MKRRVLLAGLAGGLVLFVWAIVVNGILGFRSSIDMNQVSNEREVYEVLKSNVGEPGRYVVNPALTDAGVFPGGEPVFSVLNGGLGHEASGAVAVGQIPLFLVVPILAAWMLSRARTTVLASYWQKWLFLVVFGVAVGVSSNLMNTGIGGYPPKDAVLLAINEVAQWFLAGAVMACLITESGSSNGVVVER